MHYLCTCTWSRVVYTCIGVSGMHIYTLYTCIYIYMGAKSGLWGYYFITIKIACCTKQHIFATVLRFPFKFRTCVPTPFLCVKIDLCDLHIFRAVIITLARIKRENVPVVCSTISP